MAGPGFSEETFAFFRALNFHQNREWFQENKAIYDRSVREPMIALLDQLTERFGKEDIPLRGDKKSMFRINRDVRFSKNKQPYQTHTGAVMTPSGAKDDPGLIYIHISAPDLDVMHGRGMGSFLAAGFYLPGTDMLATFRNAIRRDPAAFLALDKQLTKAGVPLGRGGSLTRLPRGFEEMKGSEVEDAIKLKSFVVEERLEPETVTSPKLADRIVAFTERSRPLLDWGWKAIG